MLCGMQYINDGDGSPALTIVPGYNSKYAVHIGTTTAVGAGMNASNDWGGFLSFDFLPPAGTTACINPATYSGIRFWARGTSGSGSMGVVVGTVENVPASNGGRCAPSADGGGCSDSTVKLNIPATWAQFTLPWNQFAGGGGMSTAGCALPPGSGIVHIQFQPYELYPAATNYKVSPMPYWLEIDNIEFF